MTYAILRALLPHILLVALIGGSSYLLYDKVTTKAYNKGFAVAETKYKNEIKVMVSAIDKKIDGLEKSSNNLAITIELSKTTTDRLMRDILKSVQGKPLFTIAANGVCTPSDDFISAYNRAVKGANQ